MINRENLYSDFSNCMFDAVIKLDPYSGTLYVAHFKSTPAFKGNEYTFEQAISYLEKRLVIDTNNVCLVTLDELKRLVEKKTGRTRYRFSALARPNIAKKYDLFLAPDTENKVVFCGVKACTVYENTITFMTKRTAENLNVSDIVYVGYGNHCVEIHTQNGQNNMFNISFNDAAEILLEYDCFLRSYKNCLVNMDNVAKIEDDAFIMNNGDVLSIPKRRLKEITNIFNEYKMLK